MLQNVCTTVCVLARLHRRELHPSQAQAASNATLLYKDHSCQIQSIHSSAGLLKVFHESACDFVKPMHPDGFKRNESIALPVCTVFFCAPSRSHGYEPAETGLADREVPGLPGADQVSRVHRL